MSLILNKTWISHLFVRSPNTMFYFPGIVNFFFNFGERRKSFPRRKISVMEKKYSNSSQSKISSSKNLAPKITLGDLTGEDLRKLQTPIAQVPSLQHIIRGTTAPANRSSQDHSDKTGSQSRHLTETHNIMSSQVVNPIAHALNPETLQLTEAKNSDQNYTIPGENGEIYLHDGSMFDTSMLLQYTDPFTMAKMTIGESGLPTELITTDPNGTLISAEVPILETEDGSFVDKYSTLPLYDPNGQPFYANGFPAGFGTTPTGQVPAEWAIQGYTNGATGSLDGSPPPQGGLMALQVEGNNNTVSRLEDQSPTEKGGNQQLPPIQASLLAFGEAGDPSAFGTIEYIQGWFRLFDFRMLLQNEM